MKRDALIALAVAALTLFVSFALGGGRRNFPAVDSHPFSTSRAVASPVVKKNVVMRINGEAITEEEFGQFLAAAPEQYRQFALTPPGRRVLADEIIKMKILAQEGRRLGAQTDAQSAAQMSMVDTNIAATFALQKVAPKPSDAEVRAAYEKQKERFVAYPVSHIVLSCEGSSIPPKSGKTISCDEAIRKAKRLAAQVSSGASFADVARRESDDTGSAANGGLLGNIGPGQLPPQVERVIFALKPGQVSDPLRTQFGVHLFTTGAPVAQPFEQVRPQLEQTIRQQRLEQILARMRSTAKVDFDPKFFGPPATSPLSRPRPAQGR